MKLSGNSRPDYRVLEHEKEFGFWSKWEKRPWEDFEHKVTFAFWNVSLAKLSCLSNLGGGAGVGLQVQRKSRDVLRVVIEFFDSNLIWVKDINTGRNQWTMIV